MLWSVTCAICAREVPRYSDFHAQQKARGIKVPGVSLDGYAQQGTIQQTMQQWNIRFPTLFADLSPFASYYQRETGEQLLGTPTFLVYRPDGRMVANNRGLMRISALFDYIARQSRE